MSDIKVTPLGAGQDVGRSCILVSIANKNVMLDCGMHMGYNDDRRFPDFSFVTRDGTNLSEYLDAVIITHFHLDHCGALPYMSEMVGYSGPIYMTQPTKAICPHLLEDYRRIAVERKGDTNFFTSQMIKDCMKKVVTVSLHQEIQVDDELTIKAYYAGHVLGAAMFEVRVGALSVVYTGDYNMTPDRHLGSAWISRCRPNLLITESTYATTIRDSRRCRERDFLLKVHECVEKGGKVLIPVFALGRAQELCILLETYWERMSLSKIPVFFAAGLTEKATNYYRMFIGWTNQKIKHTFVKHNMFEFKHIKPFDRSYIDNPGAMVVFATPGMLHAGLSLQLFKRWAPNPLNMVIMPGYCVAGTIGHKILGGAKVVELENKQQIEVKMSVQYMSFSAHADAKGIMQLIQWAEPKAVLLVHGEGEKMKFLANKINEEFKLPCYMPANGETISLAAPLPIVTKVSRSLLEKIYASNSLTTSGDDATRSTDEADLENEDLMLEASDPKRPRIVHGTLVMTEANDGDGETRMRLLEPDRVLSDLSLQPHTIRFTMTVHLADTVRTPPSRVAKLISERIEQKWKNKGPKLSISADGTISISTVLIKLDPSHTAEHTEKGIFISWADHEDDLGTNLVKIIQGLKLTHPSNP